jgi:hypothetical protein
MIPIEYELPIFSLPRINKELKAFSLKRYANVDSIFQLDNINDFLKGIGEFH